MINWIYFPQNERHPEIALDVVEAFRKKEKKIDSNQNRTKSKEQAKKESLTSNEVLKEVSEELKHLGFAVESGKTSTIQMPVMFGQNGRPLHYFEVDAYHESKKFVIEVEAGMGYVNRQFLKDLFEASVMADVDYLCIAVLNYYYSNGSDDFEKIKKWFETLYSGNRLKLPLKGVLLIGY